MHVRKVIALAVLLAATFAIPASARVVRFVIDTKTSPAFNGATLAMPDNSKRLPAAPSASWIPMIR
jgi:hypothetical protein